MSLIKKSFILGEAHFDCWIYITRNLSGNEEFWFKGRDIANYLEYKNPNDALIKSVLPIWRKNWTALKSIVHTTLVQTTQILSQITRVDNVAETKADDVPSNWHPHTIFISEPGLYALVTRSKKPEAVKFTRWIYEEVLPSLRRTGTYSLKPTDVDETRKLLDLKNRMLEIKIENMEISQELALVRSDAEKQVAIVKSEAESQLVAVKSDAEKQLMSVQSDADKQLALMKSESEKLMLLTRMTNTETVRQLQTQFNESETRYKLFEATTELEIQRLKSLARMSVMEFAVHGLLARDNIEQNEILKSTLKRLAPRVVPEVKNPQHQELAFVDEDEAVRRCLTPYLSMSKIFARRPRHRQNDRATTTHRWTFEHFWTTLRRRAAERQRQRHRLHH